MIHAAGAPILVLPLLLIKVSWWGVKLEINESFNENHLK